MKRSLTALLCAANIAASFLFAASLSAQVQIGKSVQVGGVGSGGASPAGVPAQEQLNGGGGNFSGGILRGGPNNLDMLNPGSIIGYRSDYSSSPGIQFPLDNPWTFTHNASKRFGTSDGYQSFNVTLNYISGGKNFSNEQPGDGGLVFEKPNVAVIVGTINKQSEGQVGGALAGGIINLANGDTMVQTQQTIHTGCSDKDDECGKMFRSIIASNPRRFGIVLNGITEDSSTNWIFRGTFAASYNGLSAEGLPTLDITKDLNVAGAGNITDIQTFPGDNRLAQMTPDTGINITTLLGNSVSSTSTSIITANGCSGAPGICSDTNGAGAITGATMTVTSATGFVVSATTPVCIGSDASNYELTYITAVNAGTNTLTFSYIRNQHGLNEIVAQGGGCGWALAMNADDKAPGTQNGGDYGNNATTLHNAYPVIETTGGKLILYTNKAVSQDSTPHTAAYTNTSPKVAGVLTVGMSGGALSSLTVNSNADYTTNAVAFIPGQNTLAFPTITFSGGGCAVLPSVTVKGYFQASAGAANLPILSVPGDPGWNAGSGCSGTPTATMQSVYANPYHLYPMTMSYRVIDPNVALGPDGKPTLASAAGPFVRTQAIDPSKWANGDTLEISGWWNQYTTLGNITANQIYGGQSGKFGAKFAMHMGGDVASPDFLFDFSNDTPSTHYYSPNGPSAGVAYEVPPGGIAVPGMTSRGLAFSEVPTIATISVECGLQVSPDALTPCHFNVPQQSQVWRHFLAATPSVFDSISYNNGTRIMAFTPNVTFNGATTHNGQTTFNTIANFIVPGNQDTPLMTFGASSLRYCNAFGPVAIGIGSCHIPAGGGNYNDYNYDGRFDVGTLNVNSTGRIPALNVGLNPPVFTGTLAYSGTAGSTTYTYSFAAVSPLGIVGATELTFFSVNNAAATLTSSSKVTITCGTMATQFGYPSGTSINVYGRGGGSNILIGTCPAGGGGTVIDDGSQNAVVSTPTHSYNSSIGAGRHLVELGGDIGFLPAQNTETPDTFIKRTGANDVSIGSTSGGSNAALHVGALTVNGNNVCQSTGTNCPAAGSYTLGGTLTGANIVAGTGAGTGPTVSITGAALDGSHSVQIITGTAPAANAPIWTITFTATRGHTTSCVVSQAGSVGYTSISQFVLVGTSSPTTYSVTSGTTALGAGLSYVWNVSCP